MLDWVTRWLAVSASLILYEADPATFPPGRCTIEGTWTPLTLVTKTNLSSDSHFYEFETPRGGPLRLSTSAHVNARIPDTNHVRPYTPVSGPNLDGRFALVVKSYGTGLGAHMAAMAVGDTLEFIHTPEMVSKQYPFSVGSARTPPLVMVAGGTGITPMIQALHPVLGRRDDTRRVRLFYSSSSSDGILAKKLLDKWEAQHPQQLHVRYAATREYDASWTGHRGRMDRAYFEQTLGQEEIDTALLMLCGPPGMASLLNDFEALGFSSERLFLFSG